MAITCKELTENGKQAVLELDSRGTSALIQNSERTLWNQTAATKKDIFYGVCYTDTSYTTKEVSVGTGFQLRSGVIVAVYFKYAVRSDKKLNIRDL